MASETHTTTTCDLCRCEIEDRTVRFQVSRNIPWRAPDGTYSQHGVRDAKSRDIDLCETCGEGCGLGSLFDGTAKPPSGVDEPALPEGA